MFDQLKNIPIPVSKDCSNDLKLRLPRSIKYDVEILLNGQIPQEYQKKFHS